VRGHFMTIAEHTQTRTEEGKPLILFLAHWLGRSGFAVLSESREYWRCGYHTATRFAPEGQCRLAEFAARLRRPFVPDMQVAKPSVRTIDYHLEMVLFPRLSESDHGYTLRTRNHVTNAATAGPVGAGLL